MRLIPADVAPLLPPHAIVWQVTRPRPSVARLLRALQAAALPGWGAAIVGAHTATLYVWAPGHTADLLAHLVVELPSGAAPVLGAAIPADLRWHHLTAS